MSNHALRIKDAQTKINVLTDELQKQLDSDTPDQGIVTQLTADLAAEKKNLEVWKNAEAALARQTTGTSLTVVERSSESIQELQQITRGNPGLQDTTLSPRGRLFAVPGKKVTPLDYLWRALTVDLKSFAEGHKRPFVDVLRETYGEGEHSEATRIVAANMVTKAAAIPADTTTSHWASDLIVTVMGEFIPSLIPYSIYPKLAAMGSSFTFGRNGVISLPSRNTATTIAGGFIAQGAAIPVKQGAFAAITLTPKKMGVITTMTREITEHSTPAIESILRQAILEDTGVALDTILLDATAADTTRPAGIRNVGTAITATTFTGLTGFVNDIKALVAALITQTKGNIRNPAWIMNPGSALAASLLQTTVGETPFRDEIASGRLLGYPIITSTVSLTDYLYLVDAADFATATGDTPNFSVSDQAVLHMEDTNPAGISLIGTPAIVSYPIRSLWQTDTMAVRMIMDVNWALRRVGVSQWIAAGITWD